MIKVIAAADGLFLTDELHVLKEVGVGIGNTFGGFADNEGDAIGSVYFGSSIAIVVRYIYTMISGVGRLCRHIATAGGCK